MVVDFHVAEVDVVDDHAQFLWLSFETFTKSVKVTHDLFIFDNEGYIILFIGLFEFERLIDFLILTLIPFISLLTLTQGFITMIIWLRFIKRYVLFLIIFII